MLHHLILILHLLCASIWVGGHLFIAIRILPEALLHKNYSDLLKFEKAYEPVGMPALLILVITGLWMAGKYVPLQYWFSFSSPVEKVISIKLLLLLTTLLLALSAQTRVLPTLKAGKNKLRLMAFHIIAVTITGVAMLVLGSFIRFGGL